MFDLQRPIPVLNLFRHFQCNHGASDPEPRSSDGMDLSLCGTDRRWCVHALSRSAVWFVSSGVTGPLGVSCMHNASHLFAHGSNIICGLAEDSPSMLTDITINVASVEGPNFGGGCVCIIEDK